MPATCPIMSPRTLSTAVKGHRFGSTGSQWWKRLLKGDDRLKVEGIEPLLSRAYFEQLRDHISQASDEDFGILFVHGYRVSFVDAAAPRCSRMSASSDAGRRTD